ncbi:tRNA (adenine(22)-N(1))-methyltransferase TrmK [Alkalihalobacillus sp. AL-G]|uniref:tRNA (adenine(22)-N(1))-methyltransferase n=1 Tax=Alkalihalobacillus sp. AL-G TaxID=2926399 RepID=UPI00272BBDED|nr:tRNA (adenine(22)-N(1))-methyltransferase TrmK [Alkalihalobacillus sp. AL-G]WLD92105.1 tRNA (adenine(22)-N(1))-methyltransferase TrmK [Alkalihalobacillus sp. AL-G]
MSISISKRLMKVADYIPTGGSMADIGSDHAYLPCYCVQNSIVTKAIAGEVNDGPYRSACTQVKNSELEGNIEVRLGDGLDVIASGEVSTVVIAGMGGQLIQNILEKGKNKLTGVQRLVLQPNVGARFVRSWLQENNWKLINEAILEEDDKIYEIVVAEPSDTVKPMDKAELLLGPFLINENNPAFKKKWKREMDNWERVLTQLERALPSNEIEDKKKELLFRINAVKSVVDKATN